MSAPEITGALAAAIAFRDRGWRPFPVDHPSLRRCASPHKATPCDGTRGKHPIGGWATQTACEATDGMLELWFGREPRNIGIATKPSGLVVVDEDVDGALASLAEDLGQRLPITYRVRTSRGWHWYFQAPIGLEVRGHSPRLKARGMDVRGNSGEGGYVVAAGSQHQSGHIYTAEDPLVDPAEIPGWLLEQMLAGPDGLGGEGGSRGRVSTWDDEPRHGTAVDLHAQYARHLNAVTTPGFRHSFFLAALDGWRLVRLGLLTREQMNEDLYAAVRRVWNADPDERDRRIMDVEAYAKALSSPWALIGSPGGIKVGTGEVIGVPDPREDLDSQGPGNLELVRESKILAEVERLDIREEALRRRAARKRAEKPRIADELLDVDALAGLEPPRMLLGKLIPAESIGFLNGRTGTYKSFVAVSWACTLATGRPWLGLDEFAVDEPVKVLYVAAEGPRGVAQRVISWQTVYGQISSGQLAVYPKPIKLNDEFEVAELGELVEARGIGFLVVDTLHRSIPGAEENSATEFGAVFEAVADLRDRYGLTTLFVDHTGHRGGVLGRGTTAKIDDADFALGIEREGDIPRPEHQRTLKVVKLKDEPVTGEWPIRLRAVEGAPAAVVEIGEVGPVGGVDILDRAREWHSVGEEVPEAALERLQEACRKRGGKGKQAALDIIRLLRFVGGDRGMTQSEIQSSLKEGPRQHHRSQVHAALGLLSEAGLVAQGATSARLLIDPEFA